MIPQDTFTEAFADLRKQELTIDAEEWTETDTRSKFIDLLLKDCLGWSEADIHRELSDEKQRLDYRLSTTRPQVVVEAKRASIELPVSRTTGLRRVKISKLLGANPSLKKAITQVAQYCWTWSVPIAVLTNCRTYILFIGVRNDGTGWQDGNAIVIPDIYSEGFDFAQLQGLLSRAAVAAGQGLAELLLDAAPTPPVNVLSLYNHPDATVPRNPMGQALEPLLREVFTDVTREESREVLEHCYVRPGETTLRDQEFEMLLLDRPPAYVESVVNVSSANAYRRLQEQIKESLSKKNWPQTLLVIGGVGVGKTMFLLRYFTLPSENDEFRRDTIAFYVDFRKPELDPTRVGELVYRSIREQIVQLHEQPVPGQPGTTYDLLSGEGLKQIFWPQVQRFQGLAGDLKESNRPEYDKLLLEKLVRLQEDDREFVKGACRVLRERYHRYVCVVIDNVDQCEPPYQSAVYLFARTLEDELRTLIIVALREEWYWHFARIGEGPLSAYHDIVYHIPAPRVRDVLARRLEYAIKIMSTSPQMKSVHFDFGQFLVEAHHISRYLEIVHHAFLDNEDVTLFFESLANGSVRRGLEVFLEFLRSGHTDAEDYLKAIFAHGEYVLLFHQVFKPIAFGRHFYYASYRSSVPNLFTPAISTTGSGPSYFSRSYLLNYLAARSKAASREGPGFVGIATARSLLVSLGLAETAQAEVLNELVRAGLLEPNIKMIEQPAEWKFVRITTKGLYLLRRIISRFFYWEAVMLDTPISDSATLTKIHAVYHEGTKPFLGNRLACVREFVAFLHKMEELEQMRVRSAGIVAMCPPVMPTFADMAKGDFDEVDALAKKHPLT